MIGFLFFLFLLSQVIRYLEIRWLLRRFPKAEKTISTPPPKARESFVVKRFEQRMKEALYE